MALTLSSRLGPYEVIACIGVGGIGEVFRARDTKLNRDVALKVLPDSFATDPDRLARFTRQGHSYSNSETLNDRRRSSGAWRIAASSSPTPATFRRRV